MFYYFFFFFSSRRRHTRWNCDWSSDVCSSDLWQGLRGAIEQADDDQLEMTTAGYTYAAEPPRGGLCVAGPPGPAHPATHFIAATLNEVGHHGTQIGALRDAHAWRHIDRGPHGDLRGSRA